MKRSNNIIYFDSDEDFMNFVSPKFYLKEGKFCKYIDMELSKDYQKELNNGTRFCIKDENSLIYKRQAVSERTLTKKIDNLEPWFGIEK